MNDRTAASAFETLHSGNRRFAADAPIHRDHRYDRAASSLGQAPLAAVLACSDSRVPVETIFDAGIGELFVVRTAGGVIGRVSLASLRFAVEVLGAPLLVVLGHEKCGAVEASMAESSPDWLQPVTERIRSHSEAGDDVTLAVEHHVTETARELRAELGDEVEVRAAIYEFASGAVRWL